jgi:excisionase family DNA binding protein
MHSSKEKSRGKTKIIDADRLLTVSELAWLLALKKSSVYAMTSTKRLPYIKIGSLLRFSPEDIELWLQEQKHHGMQAHPKRRSSLKVSTKKRVSSKADRINRLIEDAKREVLERDPAEEMN